MGTRVRFRDTFQEAFGEARAVDRERGVVRGAKILGYDSLHGRGYTDGAMANGARLYEGVVGNLNHAGGQSGRKRDVRDAFCVFHNPEFRPGQGLFADVHLIHPTSEFGQTFLAAADSDDPAMRRAFSFSPDHMVSGVPADKGGRKTIESIDHVSSVDLVPRGATTRGIFEGYGMIPPISGEGEEDGKVDGKEYHHHLGAAMHAIATHPSMPQEHKAHKTKHIMAALHGPEGEIQALGDKGDEPDPELSEDGKGKKKRPAEGGEIAPESTSKGGSFKEGIDVNEKAELEALRLRERVRKTADQFGVSLTDQFLTEHCQEGYDAAIAAVAEHAKKQRAREAARPRSVSRQQLQPVQEAAGDNEPALFKWAPGARARVVRP